jgi:Mn-dependent DtxR family transcriptional regulator
LLGVEDESVIYQDVEGMEHHISTQTLHQIMKFIRFSKQHPEWHEAYRRFLASEKDMDEDEAALEKEPSD